MVVDLVPENLADRWIFRKHGRSKLRPYYTQSRIATPTPNTPKPSTTKDKEKKLSDSSIDSVPTVAGNKPVKVENDDNCQVHGCSPPPHISDTTSGSKQQGSVATQQTHVVSPLPPSPSHGASNLFVPAITAFFLSALWIWASWHGKGQHGITATHYSLDLVLTRLENATAIAADCCPVLEDTSAMRELLNEATVLGWDARHAADMAVDHLGAMMHLLTNKRSISRQGTPCLPMVLIAASFNSTFKHTVEVANYHMKAFRCCERAKAGLENAIGSVNTERMKLYAGRKAKHVGLWKQMSEFIGLDTDTSFSATLHHYDLQTASLRKLDQIQKEISLAEQGFERERALWYGASETLQEVFGVVIEDLGATRGSQLCLSVDQFESLVMRVGGLIRKFTM
ncbi:hypothetical protein COCC4DRAFT_26297 [Bipolaris maydis ATCC 48331]|uniref:Uncharacterized protein n=2 Tax=Cochliobolus heterostrophus TaxID=5016 RepID=M2THW5_COCH5|nr:uncharacterized protein COCC4DRAFT_26297 [Bipolaris maydis ATCC 48331]EMD86099.1 hypothetical protein COCHEDRAFT_1035154 [Bipolaris maydis C5]KAJ5028136.1 hypothetical protein J3E73DRAFT_256047 [Bipolaris maydis]ENI02103.1 hypothetical protein COCC4DRAFT_26297 [Bipolaris maydis ATCC 48331]KAJ5062910.1 hypothetical protein J3E74DRAFT_288584 [Bipolaris maydis]KAJ6203874.1 hypothetical protein PSV09DRAFT_1035154 [Bipolaris maydis]